MYRTKIQKNNFGTSGVTLIETLLYMSLFTLLSGIMVTALITTMGSLQEIRMTRALLHTTTSGFDRIIFEVRNADTLVLQDSTLGVNSSILTVSRTENGTAQVTNFFLDNGSLMLEQDGVVQGPLNPTGVSFDRFLVRSVSANPTAGQGANSNFISFDIGMNAFAGSRTKHIDTLFGVTIKGSY